MKFDIEFTRAAFEALERLRKFDQRRIRDALVVQLSQDPLQVTRNRKMLRPGAPARWELRVGKHRVFYDVLEEEGVVRIVAIGYKEGSKLIILDEEFES